jgi:hypothetical protein
MKSPLQTAFEKMTDAELVDLHALITDRSKGQTARLFVVESHLAIEMQARGAMPTMQPATEAEMKLEMIDRIHTNHDGHVAIAKGTKNAMQNLDSEAFASTVRAHYGVNDFFGDDATDAARRLDVAFFNSAAEALLTIKAKKLKRRIQAGASKMMIHLETALRILREQKNPLQKMKKAKLRAILEDRLGEKAFSVKSESWPELWARPELAPFIEQARGGRRPTTHGKSRGVEAFDYLPTRKKTEGG